MTPIRQLVSLRSVVAMFLDESQKSDADEDRMRILAYRGMIKMNLSLGWSAKTVRLPVNGNNTVTLPPDYRKWIKVGVLNGNGEISAFKINNSLTTWNATNPSRELPTDINGFSFDSLASSPLWINYYYNGCYNSFYGAGSGLLTYGECNIDEENRVIILSPNFQYDDIMLMYASIPQSDKELSIRIELQEALIAYIKWKTNTGTRAEFYAELKEADRNMYPITLMEINQASRSGNIYGVKA